MIEGFFLLLVLVKKCLEWTRTNEEKDYFTLFDFFKDFLLALPRAAGIVFTSDQLPTLKSHTHKQTHTHTRTQTHTHTHKHTHTTHTHTPKQIRNTHTPRG